MLGRLGRGLTDTALLSAALQQPITAARYLMRHDRTDTVPAATEPANTSESPVSAEPSDAPEESVPVVIPPREDGGGAVVETQIGGGSDPVEGVSVRNKSGKVFDIADELTVLPELNVTKTDQPQVLIVHTHTTECYMNYYAGYYNPSDPTRTQDESRNVCAVGEAIAAPLRAAGIGVIHDTAVHDFPKYSGAYSRSEQTVAANLEKYPSLRVVLDIHRDCVMLNSTDKTKPTVLINGKKAAQVMIIAGVVSTDDLPNPHWQDNFHFALQLQKRMADGYGDLIRPLSLVASRYNQHLTSGYLLIEVGTDGNTLDEAVYSGGIVGKTMAQLLQEWMDRP